MLSSKILNQPIYLLKKAEDFRTIHAEEIRSRWANGMFNHDNDEIAESRAMMNKWNAQNPGQRIDANYLAIIKRVNNMRKPRDQRMADTAPKSMQAQLRKTLPQKGRVPIEHHRPMGKSRIFLLDLGYDVCHGMAGFVMVFSRVDFFVRSHVRRV